MTCVSVYYIYTCDALTRLPKMNVWPTYTYSETKLFHDRWNTQELVLWFYGMKQFQRKTTKQGCANTVAILTMENRHAVQILLQSTVKLFLGGGMVMG